jgi:hypothetical protein
VLERGREAAARAKTREYTAWYEHQTAKLEQISPAERQALLTEAGERFESYDQRVWQLEQRIKQLATDECTDQSDGGENTQQPDRARARSTR